MSLFYEWESGLMQKFCIGQFFVLGRCCAASRHGGGAGWDANVNYVNVNRVSLIYGRDNCKLSVYKLVI